MHSSKIEKTEQKLKIRKLINKFATYFDYLRIMNRYYFRDDKKLNHDYHCMINKYESLFNNGDCLSDRRMEILKYNFRKSLNKFWNKISSDLEDQQDWEAAKGIIDELYLAAIKSSLTKDKACCRTPHLKSKSDIAKKHANSNVYSVPVNAQILTFVLFEEINKMDKIKTQQGKQPSYKKIIVEEDRQQQLHFSYIEKLCEKLTALRSKSKLQGLRKSSMWVQKSHTIGKSEKENFLRKSI